MHINIDYLPKDILIKKKIAPYITDVVRHSR